MSIEAMKETRRKGDNKRLEALHTLVKLARPVKNLSIGHKDTLIENAVANATGLSVNSKKGFRSECRLVLDGKVEPFFEDVLKLSERIWNENKVEEHCFLHVVLKICTLLKGKRNYEHWDVSSIEKYYTETASLPF